MNSPRQALEPLSKLSSDDLVSIQDLTQADVKAILSLTAQVKARPAEFSKELVGKHVAIFFEKPSLRTRITFEVGIASMGGASTFVDQTRSRLDAREKLSDIAHNLERWVHGIVLRTFDHGTVTEMAEHAAIPVVNGLSDLEHPCQALADYFSLQERFSDVRKIRLAYVGDGNNVAHSLLLTAALLGSTMVIATPSGFEPNAQVFATALRIAATTGAVIQITHDPVAAVTGADAIYTDVWASMGQEHEAMQRKALFLPFQVNDSLLAHAAPHAVFMHCLPAHRGDEVTDAVIDSPSSIVFDQAENRLHVQKAILALLMGSGAHCCPPRSAHV